MDTERCVRRLPSDAREGDGRQVITDEQENAAPSLWSSWPMGLVLAWGINRDSERAVSPPEAAIPGDRAVEQPSGRARAPEDDDGGGGHDGPDADHVVDGRGRRRHEARGRAHGGWPRHLVPDGAARLSRHLSALEAESASRAPGEGGKAAA